MVAKFPFAPPKADDRREDDYYNLPRLFGRAEIDIVIREPPKRNGGRGVPGERGYRLASPVWVQA